MSTYYMFYLAKKNDEGKIKVIGPAVLTDSGNFKIKPALVRSRSYIDWEDWDFMNYLPIEEINPDERSMNLLTSDHSWNSEPNIKSDAYYCSYKEIANVAYAERMGLKVGYAPLNEVGYVAENGYCLQDKYEIEFHSADFAAELCPEERAKFGKVAFLEINSVGYICNQLVNAFHDLVFSSNGYYVVCVIG